MAKALRTAAIVVGAAALIATGVGAAFGSAAIIGGLTGTGLTSAAAIASATAGVVALPAGGVEMPA